MKNLIEVTTALLAIFKKVARVRYDKIPSKLNKEEADQVLHDIITTGLKEQPFDAEHQEAFNKVILGLPEGISAPDAFAVAFSAVINKYKFDLVQYLPEDMKTEATKAAGEVISPTFKICNRIREDYDKAGDSNPATLMLFRNGERYTAYSDGANSAQELNRICGLKLEESIEDKQGTNITSFDMKILESIIKLINKDGKRIAICDPITGKEGKQAKADITEHEAKGTKGIKVSKELADVVKVDTVISNAISKSYSEAANDAAKVIDKKNRPEALVKLEAAIIAATTEEDLIRAIAPMMDKTGGIPADDWNMFHKQSCLVGVVTGTGYNTKRKKPYLCVELDDGTASGKMTYAFSEIFTTYLDLVEVNPK